jgi:hypothetical protein
MLFEAFKSTRFSKCVLGCEQFSYQMPALTVFVLENTLHAASSCALTSRIETNQPNFVEIGHINTCTSVYTIDSVKLLSNYC